MNTTPIPETSASKAFADQGGVECDPASAGSTDDSSSSSSSTSSGTSSDSSSSSDGSSSEASDSSDGEAAYWRPARNCLTTKPQADQPGTTFAPSSSTNDESESSEEDTSSTSEPTSGGESSSTEDECGCRKLRVQHVGNRRQRRWSKRRIRQLERQLKQEQRRRRRRRRGYRLPAPGREADDGDGQLGDQIFEVFQVQAYPKMREAVLFKIDSGANITFADCVLYHHGVKMGYIVEDRALSVPLPVRGIGGRVAVTRVGTLMVHIPGSLQPVPLQVYPTATPMDRAHQVLLGTDNLTKLGAVIDLQARQTVYKSLPGSTTPVTSMHMNPVTARRQFITHRVGCDEAEASTMYQAEVDEAIPGDFRHDGEDVSERDWRWQNPEMLVEEVIAENQLRYGARFCSKAEVDTLDAGITSEDEARMDRRLRKIERAVSRGDGKLALNRLKKLVSLETGSNEEFRLLAEAARRNERVADEAKGIPTDPSGEGVPIDMVMEGEESPTTSIIIDVDPSSGKAKMDLNQKSQGDKAGTGWTRATLAEIRAHVMQASDCGLTNAMIPERFIKAYHRASQPLTAHLPYITNHYVYVRMKPDARPFKAGYRSIPHNLLGRLNAIISSMIELDVIEPTDTAVNTMPITLVLGKNDAGETTISRFCIDARQLNECLVDTTTECLPSMDDVLKNVNGAYVYSTTDACKAFWSQRIFPPDRAKCCINVAGNNYVLKRLFFGLKTGTSQHNALMTEIIGDDLWGEDDGVGLYCDDCVIYSKKKEGETHEQVMKRHFTLLTRFMEALADRGVTVSVNKSHIAMGLKGIDFLGYHLSREGISIQKQKQAAIINAPFPITQKALHTFIGGAIWLQRALNCNLAELLSPLRRYVVMSATGKKYINKYDPTAPEVIAAVEAVKERVAHSCTLRPPDWSKEFFLWVDGAQSAGIGSVITQFVDTALPGSEDHLALKPGRPSKPEYTELDRVSGLDQPNRRLPSEQEPPKAPFDEVSGKRRVGYFAPIAFYSKSLQKHHKRWTSLDVELFAIVASVRHFEHMLLGSKCVIMSDCKAIEFLHRQKELSGRVGRWANYLAQFQFSVSHCRGIENGLSDYLSRNAIPDVRMPDDGELFRDKLLTNQQGVLQFTEKNIPPRWLDNSADEVEAAVQRFKKDHQRHSLYSVCSGICSSAQATERYGLDLEVIGVCENNEDAAAELARLYPNIPNHGDIKDVISAMESGELVLNPSIVEISVPCQGRSDARQLAEWSEQQHPHHNLWRLQAKLISLMRPKAVLIENVPYRAMGAHPTQHQYVKLQQEFKDMGYHWEERNDINCASLGDHTSRERFFAVATRHDVAPFTFPSPLTKYGGMRHLMEEDRDVRRKVRCASNSRGWHRGKGLWKKEDGSPFQSEQIGFVLTDTEKEMKFQQERRERFPGIRNFKGFRVYSLRSPAPCLLAYGKEEFCGPGKNTQFYLDDYGNIRLLTVREAARIHNFTDRCIDSLMAMSESKAYSLIGNSVPVATMGAMLRGILTALDTPTTEERVLPLNLYPPLDSSYWRHRDETPPADAKFYTAQQWKAVVATSADSAEAEEDAKQAEAELRRIVPPTTEEMLEAQSTDKEVKAIRKQLTTYQQQHGEAELRKQGVDQARIKMLAQYSFDQDGLLLHAPTKPHYYNGDGRPCDGEGKELPPTEATAQQVDDMVVVPKVLQQNVCYLHHYNRLSAHPQWYDMVSRIEEAGYTWRGIKTSCSQMCKRCKICFRASRDRSKNAGLFTSRRYRRPFESISWDFQELGTGSVNGKKSLLTILCEHSGFCELYAMDKNNATAEEVSNALVKWCLRWGVPESVWGGEDTQMMSEVVRRVCARLGITMMSATPYNSNAISKQERKHHLINGVLKRLHGGHPERWDEHLPFVEHRLRNTTHLRAGYTPWQMVFGRHPRVPSRRSQDQREMKKHPRAQAYMRQLQESLSSVWDDVDKAGVLASQESFGTLNANRVPAKHSVGDFVFHYQPPVNPGGAPSKLLIPWVGPWRIEEVKRAKDVRMRHIDYGIEKTVHTTTITSAPMEESPGDYQDRYDMVQHLQDVPHRLPRDHELRIGDFMIVRVDGRYAVAEVKEAFSDGQAHVLWWNTKNGNCDPGAKWYKVFKNRQAESGEGYSMAGEPNQRMWDLLPRSSMVATFSWPSMSKSQKRPLMIPLPMRKYFGKTTHCLTSWD